MENVEIIVCFPWTQSIFSEIKENMYPLQNNACWPKYTEKCIWSISYQFPTLNNSIWIGRSRTYLLSTLYITRISEYCMTLVLAPAAGWQALWALLEADGPPVIIERPYNIRNNYISETIPCPQLPFMGVTVLMKLLINPTKKYNLFGYLITILVSKLSCQQIFMMFLNFVFI